MLPSYPTLQELERRFILKALADFGGNKTAAANALGITLKTLYNKLHDYNLAHVYIRQKGGA